MSDVRGRFWICAACRKHVPSRLAQCRCGSSTPAGPDIGLDPAGSARAPDAGEPTWFAVGPAKLVLMSVVTLGLYQVYWFYKQWRRVRDSGEDIWPIPRSLFGVIFGYSLFRRVLGSAGGAAVLALIYAALCIASNLPLPYGLVALLSVLPLALVQRVASAEAARDFPSDDPNRRLRGANWVAVAVGVAMLGFIGYGLAAREKPTSLEFLTKVAAEANQAPRTESNGVALDKVDALPAMLVYHYTVTDVARQQIQERGSHLTALTTMRLCQLPLVRQGVSIRFVYRDASQQEVAAVHVSPRDCGL